MIKKIENLMVRDALVYLFTEYQENVRNAVITRVKHQSDNNRDIVSFVQSRIRKTRMMINELQGLLGTFNPAYASKFAQQLTSEEEKYRYSSIILGRLNVAHDQGNNLKIESLRELKVAHEHAQRLLLKFEGSLWT
ncbi:MAG: hypothetical protein JRN67_04770 [Nitrososphaerota archaeon]|nr:hypothetical protein [Nitrososphaerota archaeon]